MKQIILSAITFLLFSTAFGQTQQAKFLIGGTSSFGFNSSKVEDAEDSIIVFDFSPQVGYFIVNNLATGVSTAFETTWDGNFTESSLQIGPFARYYFLSERIRPYLQAGYLFGSLNRQFDFENDRGEEEIFKQTTGTLDISGGVSFFLSKFISLDVQLSYQTGSIKQKDFEEDFFFDDSLDREKVNISAVGLNLGFSLYL